MSLHMPKFMSRGISLRPHILLCSLSSLCLFPSKVSKEYPQLFPKLNTEDTVERMFLVFHVVVRIHNDRRKPSRKKNCRKPRNIQVAVQKPEKPKKRIGLEAIARQLELADRDVIELTDSDSEESDSEIVSPTTL